MAQSLEDLTTQDAVNVITASCQFGSSTLDPNLTATPNAQPRLVDYGFGTYPQDAAKGPVVRCIVYQTDNAKDFSGSGSAGRQEQVTLWLQVSGISGKRATVKQAYQEVTLLATIILQNMLKAGYKGVAIPTPAFSNASAAAARLAFLVHNNTLYELQTGGTEITPEYSVQFKQLYRVTGQIISG